MNREIKFRAFWKTTKNMQYDIQSTYDWEMVPTNPSEDELCVLMQYTGLKDKNGKEIYEGDVCKVGVYKATILFEKGCFVANPNELGLPNMPISSFTNEFEIIGNIYENPELLNQKV
jgi:hypothetical protein